MISICVSKPVSEIVFAHLCLNCVCEPVFEAQEYVSSVFVSLCSKRICKPVFQACLRACVGSVFASLCWKRVCKTMFQTFASLCSKRVCEPALVVVRFGLANTSETPTLT